MRIVDERASRYDVPLSVDTWRASVLAAACDAGAAVGNDISGFADPDFLTVAAARNVTVVATHIRLFPRVPDPDPHYADLIAENGRRGKHDPEYELLDTGAFDDDRYWIVEVDYAKASPTDLLMTVRVTT